MTDIAASFNLKRTFWRKDPILWHFCGATNKQIKLVTTFNNLLKIQTVISFKYKDHLKERNSKRCGFTLDNNEFAHAFFPPPDNSVSEIHINQNKDWDKELYDISKDKLSLFITLAHEIGHAIGLNHSPNYQLLMHPVYRKPTSPFNAEDFELSHDDQLAVASLYGQRRIKKKSKTTTMTTKRTFSSLHSSPPAKQPEKKKKKNNDTSPDLCKIEVQLDTFIVKIYMMSYPGFKLLNGFPRKQDTIGVTSKLKINAALNSYTGRTYIFYEQNFFVELDECLFSSRRYGYIYNKFDAFPSSISGVLRDTNGYWYIINKERFYQYDEFNNKMQLWKLVNRLVLIE
ncbi:hypothetical protein FQA39_LY16341 [Lamprigera yunnana]|nr:hypothetical protein FQA39_LY16341 [Lamprigera yunnana]